MGALGATDRSSKETATQTLPRQVLREQGNVFAVSTEASPGDLGWLSSIRDLVCYKE